jgi:hypothetical protein
VRQKADFEKLLMEVATDGTFILKKRKTSFAHPDSASDDHH